MNKFAKLPLYIGISVFVMAIVFSAVKVGQNGSLTGRYSQATNSGAVLSLKFTPPNSVSVLLNSPKAIGGLDIVISFDPNKVDILPSTLSGGSLFKTTGGQLDSQSGTFSFTVLSNSSDIKSAIVATFKLRSKTGKNVNSALKIVTGEDKSFVAEKETGENILTSVTGTSVDVSAQ